MKAVSQVTVTTVPTAMLATAALAVARFQKKAARMTGVSAAASLNGYKIAFCFPYLLLALGTVQILRLSRIARASGRGTPADDTPGLVPATLP